MTASSASLKPFMTHGMHPWSGNAGDATPTHLALIMSSCVFSFGSPCFLSFLNCPVPPACAHQRVLLSLVVLRPHPLWHGRRHLHADSCCSIVQTVTLLERACAFSVNKVHVWLVNNRQLNFTNMYTSKTNLGSILLTPFLCLLNNFWVAIGMMLTLVR